MKKISVRRLATLVLFGLQISGGPARAEMLDQTASTIQTFKEAVLSEPETKNLEEQDPNLALNGVPDEFNDLASAPVGVYAGPPLMTSTKAPHSIRGSAPSAQPTSNSNKAKSAVR